MTAEEYFESKAHFNKWLKELTNDERAMIILMIGQFAVEQIEELHETIKTKFSDNGL